MTYKWYNTSFLGEEGTAWTLGSEEGKPEDESRVRHGVFVSQSIISSGSL